jgi:hypothetical protein
VSSVDPSSTTITSTGADWASALRIDGVAQDAAAWS